MANRPIKIEKRLEQMGNRGKYTNDRQVHKKVLTIISHQKNVTENHKDLTGHSLLWLNLKRMTHDILIRM